MRDCPNCYGGAVTNPFEPCPECSGTGDVPDLRDQLIWWWERAKFIAVAAVCRFLPHAWCEWDTLDPGPGGRPVEYRVCNRCCEIEEREPVAGRARG